MFYQTALCTHDSDAIMQELNKTRGEAISIDVPCRLQILSANGRHMTIANGCLLLFANINMTSTLRRHRNYKPISLQTHTQAHTQTHTHKKRHIYAWSTHTRAHAHTYTRAMCVCVCRIYDLMSANMRCSIWIMFTACTVKHSTLLYDVSRTHTLTHKEKERKRKREREGERERGR